ncbi:helix-turn-helix transcriptional regulator [Kocuria rhizophila]|uniref:MerR family transcriptional regulator n=1 Tax=Kocuria rhizophila TaxID=72000 RepID=A0AAX2SET0_KOCRH|nr:helix-turn-helix transcriptional regulator [Kocuria rhizophila]MCR4526233.1 helix-turn-helix transcriptional regulator [Kocuria rhizophila]MDA4827973.1 helix-turn-helix transcriptional regulator [Kocuria rhizophila]TFI00508.1 MerR family transcriptional regulator [Kocuria rhizophila]TFI06809.1 MerR family transcriptional regulator [Kocuria rhizophila]
MALDFTQPVFVISVAAELADMHPQTLRQYDRMGLVTPSRASGRARRYSQMDVQKLRQIQELSQEGVSLEGIKRIMQLENQVQALQSRVTELSEELDREREARRERDMIFTAGSEGDVVRIARGTRRAPRKVSQALMLYRPARPEHGGRETAATDAPSARGTKRSRSAS